MANILQIPVPVQNAALAWPTRTSDVSSLLFINQDLNNTIWIGQQSSITAGGQNTIPIPPNGTFSGDASSPWYVIGSVAGTQPLVVAPNGQAYFLGLTQGLGNLVIPSVQSPGFGPSTGWQIRKDGTATFNNLIIRNGLQLEYSPSAGFGNLIASITATAGSDSFGNAYLDGETSYVQNGSVWNAIQMSQGRTRLYYASSAAGPWNLVAITGFSGTPGSAVPLQASISVNGGVVFGNLAGASLVNWLFPSGDGTGAKDTAAINAAISALPATGGTVNLAPGNWYVKAGQISITTADIYLKGAGEGATVINCVGNGDLIRMGNPATPNTRLGGVLDLTLDGASTSGVSAGIHIGDGILAQLRCTINNFPFAGSIGLHIDNTASWSEQFHGTVRLHNCASHVVFDVTSNGFNSFARTDLSLYIDAFAGQDGVVVQNGAFLYDSALAIRGNFASSNATPMSTAVLRVTGQAPVGDPNASGFTTVKSSRLDIGVECTTGTFTPSTIIFGTTGSNSIQGCYGVMDFSINNSPFTKSNYVTTNANTFNYLGPVMGDTNLSPGNGNGVYSTLTSSALQYNKSDFNGSNGNIFMASGDFFANTLSANITITPQGPFITGPQRKTIRIIQAAVGSGPFTVAWPHNAAPTPAAPKIEWTGGTAPTMTATANAVDVYKLETLDGATWTGQAIQNVS